MRLVKVETRLYHPNALDCTYKCTKCGREIGRGGHTFSFCPSCGHKLDTEGKPFSIEDTDQHYGKYSVALAFLAIRAGLLKDGMPDVQTRGNYAETTYVVTSKEGK